MFLRHEKKNFFLSRQAPKAHARKKFSFAYVRYFFFRRRPAHKSEHKVSQQLARKPKRVVYTKAKKAGQALVPGHIRLI